ncbi:MAG: DUF6273 domain-containing protein [Saccharofermentans sp.]|nr:DUF6273 domain-containing protein [Saccharofermentans sp.]
MKDLKVGTVITFANMEWKVLEVNEADHTALLITDKPLSEPHPYHEFCEAITWEKCSLRKWLNSNFISENFTDEEKTMLVECVIHTPDNKIYNRLGGNPTKDKVWIPSSEEIEKYFPTNEERANGQFTWLRDPGFYQFRANCIRKDGSISRSGDSVGNRNSVFLTVRIVIN